VKGIQQLGRAIGGDYFERMGLEGEGDARSVYFPGPFDHLSEYGLVAEMYAVEIPQGKYRVPKPLGKAF
jgi:hypothetical protein